MHQTCGGFGRIPKRERREVDHTWWPISYFWLNPPEQQVRNVQLITSKYQILVFLLCPIPHSNGGHNKKFIITKLDPVTHKYNNKDEVVGKLLWKK